MEYRRDIDKPIWHYCDRCPLWPEETYNIIVSEKLPPDFELCEICSELPQQGRMEFRSHSMLICDGIMTWPPNWALTFGPGPRKFVSGEIGILEAVFISKVVINKVYLLTQTEEGNTYIGILPFENASSAKAVFDFLYEQRGKPLATIGSLMFPENPPSEYDL